MLNESIIRKMQKYNKIRRQADELQYEIENYLEENYNIDETSFCYTMDGVIPIYEWGERYFDIEHLIQIVSFIEKTKKETGETPDVEEIAQHFLQKYGE